MIRDALFIDLPAIVDLGEVMVAEAPAFAGLPYDRVKVYKFLESLLDSANGILLVSDTGNALNGAMSGAVGEHLFCNVRYAFDSGLFVAPTARGSIVAARLVKAFERRARQLGARFSCPAVMTGRFVRTTKFYQALGYRLTGAQFIKGL